MFAVVRSVFWLTVAYMVIKPGVELPDPNVLSQQAMAAGSRVISEQIQNIECDTLQCIGGKAIVTAALPVLPPVGTPMHEQPTVNLAPVPRPRPAWAG